MTVKKIIMAQPLLFVGIALLLLVASISLLKGASTASQEPDQPGFASVKAQSNQASPEASPEALPEALPEARSELKVKSKPDAIGAVLSNIRVVMPTVKNCKIIGAKVNTACAEVEIYQNARDNKAEVVSILPNGRKVEILENAGEWSHVRIFDIDGTPSAKVGWVRTVWIVKINK